MCALHAKTKHVRLYTYRAVKIEDKVEWVKASSKLQTDNFELPKDRSKILYAHYPTFL